MADLYYILSPQVIKTNITPHVSLQGEVEKVVKIEQAVEKECVVCSDLPAEVVFEPCQHKVACTGM